LFFITLLRKRTRHITRSEQPNDGIHFFVRQTSTKQTQKLHHLINNNNMSVIMMDGKMISTNTAMTTNIRHRRQGVGEPTRSSQQQQQQQVTSTTTTTHRNKKVCIFELPYDWDQNKLPPTVHSGDVQSTANMRPSNRRSRKEQTSSSSSSSRSSRPQSSHPMWSTKAYITTSCDMGDDISSLELDVEEGSDGCSSSDNVDTSFDCDDDDDVLFDHHPVAIKSSSSRKIIKIAWWRRLMMKMSKRRHNAGRKSGGSRSTTKTTSPLSLLIRNSISFEDHTNETTTAEDDYRCHGGDSDDTSVETVTSYRWISPSTQHHHQQQQQQQKPKSKTSLFRVGRVSLRVSAV
jgi:hypothetical protein